MKKLITTIVIAFTAIVFLAGCQKQSQFVASSVSTQDYTSQGESTLILNGTLVSKGNCPYDLGFVIADGPSPIASADTKSKGTIGVFYRAEQGDYSSGDKFISTFTASPFIHSAGKYYYRALVIDINPETGEYVYSYGEDKSFTLTDK